MVNLSFVKVFFAFVFFVRLASDTVDCLSAKNDDDVNGRYTNFMFGHEYRENGENEKTWKSRYM